MTEIREILAYGTKVAMANGQIRGTVLGFNMFGGAIRYQISYWSGGRICEDWMDACEVFTVGEHRVLLLSESPTSEVPKSTPA